MGLEDDRAKTLKKDDAWSPSSPPRRRRSGAVAPAALAWVPTEVEEQADEPGEAEAESEPPTDSAEPIAA